MTLFGKGGLFGEKKTGIRTETSTGDIAETIMATEEALKAGMLKNQRGVKEGWISETEMAMVVAVAHIVGGEEDQIVKELTNALSIEITKLKFKMGNIKREDILKVLKNFLDKFQEIKL